MQTGFRFQQGRAFWEAATGGAMPNYFTIGDLTNFYQPVRNGQNWGEPVPYPVFAVEEQTGACCKRDCFCRCCCSPKHPSVSYLYEVEAPQDPGDCVLCGQFCWHQADVSYSKGPPIMTYERIGCCQRLPNCLVCCEMCQDEMRFYDGGIGDPETIADEAGSLMNYQAPTARGIVPIGGGGCTPTVEIFEGPPGQAPETPMAVVEGPMCFGGIKDWCCDTEFVISREAGGQGDVAKISKRKPHDLSSCCKAACSTADTYDVALTDPTTSNKMKSLILGELVHVDYMFFEEDRFPITCEKQGDTNYLTILCCLCYCYGCLCPCKCSIPCSEKNGGGD